MKTFVENRKWYLFILVVFLAAFGMQGTSQAQAGNPTLTASLPDLSDLEPLTEAMLDGTEIILTLGGGKFVKERWAILDALTFSGINNVWVSGGPAGPNHFWKGNEFFFKHDLYRESDAQVKVTLRFTGNIDTDKSLVITVAPEAIVDYDGPPLTAEIPVLAVKESLRASTEFPLTEANLHGNVVTLTLHGRRFKSEDSIEDAVSYSGVDDMNISVERISDTKATLKLTFDFYDEDFDEDVTLTLTVDGKAFDYNKSFTFEFPMIAEVETELLTLTASTPKPLTEATLDGSIVRLKLGGAPGLLWGINDEEDIAVSGIDGIGVYDADDNGRRVAVVKLRFDGSMNTDGTLTFSIPRHRILHNTYKGPPFSEVTAQIPVKDSIILEGPWLWMAVPTGDKNMESVSTEIDSLAAASDGAVTEAQIAQNGAKAGDSVGESQWISRVISRSADTWACKGRYCWANNLNAAFKPPGLSTVDVDITAHTAYGLIYLSSPRNQNGTLQLRSTDTVKVWLNGTAIHRQTATRPEPRVSNRTPRSLPVMLKAGNNLLLVKVQQDGEYWDLNVALDDVVDITTSTPKTATPPVAQKDNTATPETSADTNAVVSISPVSLTSPHVGRQLKFNLNITDAAAVAGYQATVQFDTAALRYVSGTNGDYLPAGAFFAPPVVEGNRVKLNAASLAGESEGSGTLATLTFEVIAAKTSTLTLSHVLLSNSAGETSAPQVEDAKITAPTGSTVDVNGDGQVNIADLVLVASNLGKTGQGATDVNGDGQVNIADLVLVAGALGTAAAPSLLHPDTLEMLTSADVRLWLSQAQQLGFTDTTSQSGILFLQQLLAVLIPKETALLTNYPNPFNPETWIPYQLAKPAEVIITIYAANGQVVRALALGHQPAGIYQSRSRAAYWDGRNALGEPVASGLYFYTLIAGDFTATRKMLIRK